MFFFAEGKGIFEMDCLRSIQASRSQFNGLLPVLYCLPFGTLRLPFHPALNTDMDYDDHW